MKGREKREQGKRDLLASSEDSGKSSGSGFLIHGCSLQHPHLSLPFALHWEFLVRNELAKAPWA